MVIALLNALTSALYMTEFLIYYVILDVLIPA